MYEQIVRLHAQKLGQREIAQQLGIGERTIGTWLAKGMAPEVRYRRKERSHFDPYAAYVLQRWGKDVPMAYDYGEKSNNKSSLI